MAFGFGNLTRTYGPGLDNAKIRRQRLRREQGNLGKVQAATDTLPDVSGAEKAPSGVFAPPILRKNLSRERALFANLEPLHRGLLTDESKRAGTYAKTDEFQAGLETDLGERLPGAARSSLQRQEGILSQLRRTNPKRQGALNDVRGQIADIEVEPTANGGAQRRGLRADVLARVQAQQKRQGLPQSKA